MESPLRLSSVEINYWQHNSRQSVSTCLTLSFQCFLPIIRFNLIIKSPLQRFQTRHRSHLSKWVKTDLPLLETQFNGDQSKYHHHHHCHSLFRKRCSMFIMRRVQCLLCLLFCFQCLLFGEFNVYYYVYYVYYAASELFAAAITSLHCQLAHI